jgi:hypothetical protein
VCNIDVVSFSSVKPSLSVANPFTVRVLDNDALDIAVAPETPSVPDTVASDNADKPVTPSVPEIDVSPELAITVNLRDADVGPTSNFPTTLTVVGESFIKSRAPFTPMSAPVNRTFSTSTKPWLEIVNDVPPVCEITAVAVGIVNVFRSVATPVTSSVLDTVAVAIVVAPVTVALAKVDRPFT